MQVKLGDFSLSVKIDKSKSEQYFTGCTPRYASPIMR